MAKSKAATTDAATTDDAKTVEATADKKKTDGVETTSASASAVTSDSLAASDLFASAPAGAGGMSDEKIRMIATTVSGARIGFGVAAILLPGLARRMLGLGKDQDTAGLRMMSRLFGVREIAVGAHAIAAVQDSARRPDVFAMNAAVDGGDAAVLLMTLATGKGARRAAVGSLLLAVPIVSTWLWLRRASSDGGPGVVV